MPKTVSNYRGRLIAGTCAILAIAAVLAVGFSSRVSSVATVAIGNAPIVAGDPAPNFTLPTTGGSFDLASVDEPVLLEVFATWCPHCQREVTTLNKLCGKYGKRLKIVAVCGSPFSNPETGAPETQADVVAFAQYFKATYPVAYDPDLGVAKAYLKTGYPTFVIIGADKKIAYVKSGEVSEAELDAALTSVVRS